MKTKDFSYYKDLASRRLEKRSRLMRYFQAVENTYHNLYNLPAEIRMLQWVRKVIDTSPHDAVETVERVISSRPPRIRVIPYAPDEDNKMQAQKLEYALLWSLKDANRRRRGSVERDMAHSAILYSEIIANVIDLDYQIGLMKASESDTERLEAMRKFGRFMINVFNPKTGCVQYSSLGPEDVLVVQERPAFELVKEWGKLADNSLRELAEKGEKVRYYDYWNYRFHVNWYAPGSGGAGSEHLILPESLWEHDLGFLPWVAEIGGNTLDEDPIDQRQGLLYSVVTSGSWDTINILGTLEVSEAIAHAAGPRYKEEGPMPESTTEIDYGDPAQIAKVTPGNQLTSLNPPQLDQALEQLRQVFQLKINQSTVSDILRGGAQNMAFAAQNQGILSALGQIKPFMDLESKALSGVFTLLLRWAVKTGRPLYARGMGRSNLGQNYEIRADEIDPDSLCIEVELDPDLPLDRMQRVNSAVMAQQLDLSHETALEQLGVSDPKAEIRQRYFEMFIEAKFQTRLAMMQAKAQMDMQNRLRTSQLQAAQAAQNGPGIPGVEGAGFDPSIGGTPPAVVAPGATREMQTGLDMGGFPIAGGV